ncbi:MAG: hypothetical protein ACLGG0_03355 [Bacteriovoracia bacterium]
MAKAKAKTKMKAVKPAAKAKGKVVATKTTVKAKAKPAAKKVVAKKPAAPAKKSILKTAGKLAGKAMAALSKVDKERAKKEALKAKALAAKEKELAKKEAAKAKLEAAKEKERAKKAAALEKASAQKEKELAKKEAEKAKIQAAKDAEKNKKLAAKDAEKAAKLKAKEDEKAAKMKAKEDAKKRARGEEVEDEAPRARGGDEDDDEADFKRVAAKGKGGRKFDEEGSHDLERGFKKYSVNDLEGKIADEIAELREHFAWKDILSAIATLEFFVDPKDDSCVEKGCDNIRTTLSWCRLHYLKNWKGIQRKKEILAEGKLQEYIEELISKYPPKYIDAITNDLSDDKEFYKVLNELNITNEFDFEEEDFEADNDEADTDDISIERFSGSMRYEDTE